MGVISTILVIDTVLYLGFTVILTGAQIIMVNEAQTQLLRGYNSSFTCFFPYDVNFTQHQWYFTQEGSVERTLTNSTRYALTCNRLPSDKLWVHIHLLVRNVTFSDTGIYTCEVSSSNGTYRGNMSLKVHDKPTVTVFKSNYNVGIGDNLTVHCSIDGNGSTVTNVYWRKETIKSNEYVKLSERIFWKIASPSINFNNVILDDAGKYSCFGQTVFGTTESLQVSVQIFSKPYIIVPAHEYQCQNGTAVSLKTKVKTQTLMSIQWEKFKEENQQWFPIQNNSRLSWNFDNPSLNISTALVEDDGKYRISAKTAFHEATSPSMSLTVYVPVKIKELDTEPTLIHEGDKVEIRCLVDGKPEPNVTWKFANGTMNSLGHAQGNILVLEQVTNLNEGNYTCTAQNNFSVDQSFISLTVIPVFSRKVTDLPGSSLENYLIPSVSVFVSVALISLIVVIILIRRKRQPVRTENVSNSKPRRKSNGHEQHSPLENIRSENDHAKFYVNLSGDTTYAQVIRKSNREVSGNIGNTNNISASKTRIRESNQETGTSQVYMNIDNTYATVQKPSSTPNTHSNNHEETESDDTQLNGPEELKYTELDFSTNTLSENNRSDFIRGEPSTMMYADVVFPR